MVKKRLLARRVEPFVKFGPLLIGSLVRLQVINVVALLEVDELFKTLQSKLDRFEWHRGRYLMNGLFRTSVRFALDTKQQES